MVPAGLCAYRDLRRKRARKWGDTVTQPDDPRRVGVIVELIDHTIAIAKLNERGDLVQRLTRARQRITDPQVRVVIAGLLKQGKSQLLNSLLNLPAARVGDDEATVVITVVSYSAQPSARLVLAAGPNNLPARTPPKPTTATIEIPKIPKPVTTARTKTVRWRPAIVAGAAGDGVSRLLVTTTTLR